MNKKRALLTMRKLVADGWHAESLLVDTDAEVLGGTDEARKAAQAVFDAHYRITEAN